MRGLGRGFLRLPPLQSVLWTGVGLVGSPMAESYISAWVPTTITANTIGKYAVRVGTVLALSYLVKTLIGRAQGAMVAIGGGAYVLVSAVKEFAPGMIPGMSAYKLPGMAAYPATSGRNYTALGAPAWGARNSTAFAAGGAANVVAGRFRRFQ